MVSVSSLFGIDSKKAGVIRLSSFPFKDQQLQATNGGFGKHEIGYILHGIELFQNINAVKYQETMEYIVRFFWNYIFVWNLI